MLNAKITGLASYIPDSILDNEMLSKMVDTNDEWITTRVGVKERRILRDPDKGSSYMGIKAVNKMLAETGTNPQDIDLLICATSNPDYRFPSTASVIAHGCGLDRASATTSRPLAPVSWWPCRTPEPTSAPASTRK